MIQRLILSLVLLCSACDASPVIALLQMLDPPAVYTQAQKAYGRGEYETAIAIFQQFLQAQPDSAYAVKARYYLGRSYYLSKHYAEAIASYQQLKDGEVAGLLAHYELCKTYLANEEHTKAEEQLQWLKEEALLLTHARYNAKDAFTDVLPTQTSWQEYYRNLAHEMTGHLAYSFRPIEAAGTGSITPAVAAPVNAPPQSALSEMGKNGVGRPNITYKEKARYTEVARLNLVQGTVVLNVVFTADGELSNIRVVRSLADGLTEKAIEAAKKIRFQPATKDGAPVSVRGNLEFTFNLY